VGEKQQQSLGTRVSRQLFRDVADIEFFFLTKRFLFFGDWEGSGSSYPGWVGEEWSGGSGQVDVGDVRVTSLSELK
jgi:hypothetical protein